MLAEPIGCVVGTVMAICVDRVSPCRLAAVTGERHATEAWRGAERAAEMLVGLCRRRAEESSYGYYDHRHEYRQQTIAYFQRTHLPLVFSIRGVGID